MHFSYFDSFFLYFYLAINISLVFSDFFTLVFSDFMRFCYFD